MSHENVSYRFGVTPLRVALWGVVIGLEIASLIFYFGITDAQITSLRYVLYPFVWINVGLWAVVQVDTPESQPQHKLVAGLVSVIYFLVLMYFASLIGFVSSPSITIPELMIRPVLHAGHAFDTGWSVSWLSPGWGPVLQYTDGFIYLKIVPFMTLGYAALSYLVYVALLETAHSVMASGLGLVSCVGCTWPVAASLLAGVAGGLEAGSAVYSFSYGLSTIVFVLAVGVLYWRPFS